jgi:hypothetical protein
VLDTFNRANANTLGGNWRQLVVPIFNAGIRVNTTQASASFTANAYWNAGSFGTQQAAAFAFANNTLNSAALYLKAGGTFTAGTYQNAVRVRYQAANGGQVLVDATNNFGLSYTQATVLNSNFVSGNILTALVDATGKVTVWKTAGSSSTILGTANTTFTGSGSIGLSLPTGARVDNFAGGSVQ